MPNSVEQWRWVVGYEGRYEVSDQGRIRSWLNRGGQSTQPGQPRVNKSTRNWAGYHVVSLRGSDGSKRQRRLHCLVLEAFVGPRPEGFQGAHEDDNKDDNRLGNLAWKHLGDNIIDRNLNNRTARGTSHGAYKHGKFIGTNRKYYPPKYVGRATNEKKEVN